jgi:MFS family permease
MTATRGAWAAYPLLLALGALDATGYSVIVPVAPVIADTTGAGPATIGLLVASFPTGMVVGFALAGSLVRRRGARALLVGSLTLVALGALGFVLGDSLEIYFASRLLMGLASGGIWIGVTFDRLQRCPGQEYLCMSRIFASYSVGGLIGPTLGAFGGIRGSFLAYLTLLLAAVPLVLLVDAPAQQREFAADRAVLRTRGFWVASAAILFAVLALGVLEGVLPLHFAERLSQARIGGLYVGASVLVAACAAAAGGMRPRPLVFAAVLLAVAGTSLGGWRRTSQSGCQPSPWPRSGSASRTPDRSGCWLRPCPCSASSPPWSCGRRSHRRVPARPARRRHRRRPPRLRVCRYGFGGRRPAPVGPASHSPLATDSPAPGCCGTSLTYLRRPSAPVEIRQRAAPGLDSDRRRAAPAPCGGCRLRASGAGTPGRARWYLPPR